MPSGYSELAGYAALIVAVGGVIGTLWTQHKNQLIQRENAQTQRHNADTAAQGQVAIKELDLGDVIRRDLITRVGKLEEQNEACLREQYSLRSQLLRALQWVWTLQAEVTRAGIEVKIPADLELEGYRHPEVYRAATGSWPTAPPPNTTEPGADPPPTRPGGGLH